MPEGNSNQPVDVAAIVKSVTEEVTKAFSGQIAELAKNQKVLADTFAADQAKAAEAAKAADAAAKAGGTKEAAEATAAAALTAEGVQKIVADAIAADRKAQSEASGKSAARQATIEKLTKEKLGGSANLAKLLTGSTDEELAVQADALAAEAKALKPDFGTNANGGQSVNSGAELPAPGNLTAGQAAYAKTIQLPK